MTAMLLLLLVYSQFIMNEFSLSLRTIWIPWGLSQDFHTTRLWCARFANNFHRSTHCNFEGKREYKKIYTEHGEFVSHELRLIVGNALCLKWPLANYGELLRQPSKMSNKFWNLNSTDIFLKTISECVIKYIHYVWEVLFILQFYLETFRRDFSESSNFQLIMCDSNDSNSLCEAYEC